MSNNYDFKNIRALLIEGFTKEDILDFCFFESDFKKLYDQLSKDADKVEIVRRLIEYAYQRVLVDILLSWARKSNPNRYQQHQPYITPTDERWVRVPLLGHIAAGNPIMLFNDPYDSETNYIELPSEWVPKGGSFYALIAKGQSMIDALIYNDDIVLIDRLKNFDNGDIVVAWLPDQQETTLKCFFNEGDRIRLQPKNKIMEPIYVDPDKVEIYGPVVRVIPSFMVKEIPQLD